MSAVANRQECPLSRSLCLCNRFAYCGQTFLLRLISLIGRVSCWRMSGRGASDSSAVYTSGISFIDRRRTHLMWGMPTTTEPLMQLPASPQKMSEDLEM